MEGIWALVFVGYIIFKILGKNRPDVTNKLPKEWKQMLPKKWEMDSPKGPGFPWDWDDEEADDAPSAPQRVDEKRQTISTQPAQNPAEISRAKNYPVQKAASPGGAKSTETRNRGGEGTVTARWPLLGADTIVNGIIFNEILGPPRSRRKRTPGPTRY